MNLSGLIGKVKFLLNENASTILTGVGVAGTVSTAYLSGRASFKAAEILKNVKEEVRDESGYDIVPTVLTKKETFKLVWRLYLPAAGTGALTITAIVTANRLDAKKIAALTVASGISARELKEYKEKVLEKLGDKQETAIRDEIAQDRVTKNPPMPNDVIMNEGQVLCFDDWTGRYFKSTVEDIKKAENKINFSILNDGYASLSEFFEEVDLAPTSFTDMVGWEGQQRVDVKMSTTMSTDNRPCIVLNFSPAPSTEYRHRFHE